MKLSCPECFSEFEVPASFFGAGGRRVRCASCRHIWFQEPPQGETPDMVPATPVADDTQADTAVPDTGFSRFDNNMPFEPIPPSLHPEDDEALSHDEGGINIISAIKSRLNLAYLARLFVGFALAGAVFSLLLWAGALAGLHKGALRGFYAPFGIVHEAAPAKLSIENSEAHVTRDADGNPLTLISGVVRNISDIKTAIPLMEITIMSETGNPGDSAYIKLETDMLAPGQAVAFDAEIPSAMTQAESLRIRFIN